MVETTQKTAKALLKPNEYLVVNMLRNNLTIDDASKIMDISRQTLSSWINNHSEPARKRRDIIAKKFPLMKKDDWLKHHLIDINTNEALYIYMIRFNKSYGQIINSLKINRGLLIKTLHNEPICDEKLVEKIWKLTEKVYNI